MAVQYVAHVGRTEMLTGFWWGKLRERDYLEDIKMDLTETGRDWIGFTWLWTVISGRLL